MKNILIIHTHGGMGDLILSSVLAEALKHHHPDCRVTFWAHPRFSALLAGHPFVDACLNLDPAASFFTRLQTIRAEHYDAVLIPWSSSSHAWLVFFAGIPVRVGQGGRLGYSFLFTHRVRVRSVHGDTASHWTEVQLDYARILGCTVPSGALTPKIGLSPEEKHFAANYFRSSGIDPSRPLCGLHICKGLSADEARWPVDRFVEIGVKLVEQGWSVVLTGTEKEKPLVDLVEQRLSASTSPKSILNAAGQFTLRETAAFISRMNAFVCPDTGPGHLAAALGVPVVSIFALRADFPNRWRPIGAPYAIIRATQWDCTQPCIKETCPRLTCLLRIDPDEVVRKVEEITS